MAARSAVHRMTCACMVACAGAPAWGSPSSAPAASSAWHAPGCHGAQEQAIARLSARVRREHLYESWSKPGCLDYVVDRCTTTAVEITLHEDHAPRCGGDPGTWPSVESFRVHVRGRRIDWYNLPDDTWRPFDKIHSEGRR